MGIFNTPLDLKAIGNDSHGHASSSYINRGIDSAIRLAMIGDRDGIGGVGDEGKPCGTDLSDTACTGSNACVDNGFSSMGGSGGRDFVSSCDSGSW